MIRTGAICILASMGILSGGTAARADAIAQFDFFSSPGNVYAEPFYTDYNIAQTFTPTLSGTVTSVDLTLDSLPDNNPDHLPLNVTIQTLGPDTLNGRQPTGDILSSGSIAYDDPQFDNIFISWINIPMTGVQLDAGQMYALVATVGSPSDTYPDQAYYWYSKYEQDENGQDIDLYSEGQLAVGYSGGIYAQQTNNDVPFRINAIVPEPASFSMLILTGGCVAMGRRRLWS